MFYIVARLEVLKHPHPILRQKAEIVRSVDKEVLRVLGDMLETMYMEQGCGLAANQVGVLQRLIVVDISFCEPEFKPIKMINPSILWASSTLQIFEEGCLSVNEKRKKISRADSVHVAYQDEHGHDQKIEAHGFLSTCLQHEIDHLDGYLYIDRLITQEPALS